MEESEKNIFGKPQRDFRRDILAKAIADPEFRYQMFKNPEKVFGGELTKTDYAAVERMKVMFRAFDDIIGSLAGEVLCGGGGGCGGLA